MNKPQATPYINITITAPSIISRTLLKNATLDEAKEYGRKLYPILPDAAYILFTDNNDKVLFSKKLV